MLKVFPSCFEVFSPFLTHSNYLFEQLKKYYDYFQEQVSICQFYCRSFDRIAGLPQK